jgi:hypothetical protein
MSVREHLTQVSKRGLRQVGWSEGAEFVRLARWYRQTIHQAIWLHKARELPKEEFKRGATGT